MKKYKIRVSVPLGDGKRDVLESTIEGDNLDERDAEVEAWNLLNSMGVETGWEEVTDNKTDD